MDDFGKYHVKVFYVEGLNMENERFIWNNKLMFIRSGSKYSNVAEAQIFVDSPLPNFKKDTKKLDSGNDDEYFHLLNVFLSCFKLVNKHPELTINLSEAAEYPIKNIEDFKSSSSNIVEGWGTSGLPQYPVKDCLNRLEKTIPLFEKVMKKLNFTQKKRKNPLFIALLLFHRTTYGGIQTIIDYVTILESLISENESELKFKFALRTTLLIEKDLKKRKDIFESLREVYNIRSSIIHGSDISSSFFDSEEVDFGIILWLENVVKKALLEYIELTSLGLTKKEIISKLDMIALGLSDDSKE